MDSAARDLGVARPGPVDDLDWSPQRSAALGHDSVQLWERFLRELPDLPVQRGASSEDVLAALAWTVPDGAEDTSQLLADTAELLLEHSTYPGNGGFLGYVSGSGTVPGAAADLLTAALNNNVGGWRLAPGLYALEQHLLRWFTDGLGLPAESGGYLTSGGSAANHDALVMARDARAGWDVRRLGTRGGPRLTVHAPVTVHDTIQRGADLVGLGHDAVRVAPVGRDERVDVDALRAALAADVEAGDRPVCVVASAGTVGTGAVDDLAAVADVAQEFGAWFHVDGAVGAVGALVDELRGRFAGIERADSVSLDPHKWLYVPIACGVLLVRDADELTRSFGVEASYVVQDTDAPGIAPDAYTRSPFFTRHGAALKVWWSLRAHGWDAYQRRMVHDCRLAGYLHDLAEAHPRLEPTNDPQLMIATFRYVPRDARGPDAVDELNRQILERLQRSGRVYPSNAVIGDRFVLRACIVNHRTEAVHLETLVDLAVTIGDELAAAG